MKKNVASFILFFIIIAFAGEKGREINFRFISDKKLEAGEELKYVVSYSLLKIGEVKIKVKEKKEVNGKYYYSAAAYIDSYSGIPFVNLHQIYETVLNSDYYSTYFKGLVKHDDYTTYTEYDFQYDKSLVQIKKGKVYPRELWTDSTAQIENELHDGLSILYFARMNSGVKKSINLSCFVNEETAGIKINFYKDNMPVEIDAVNYEVDCVRLDGSTDVVSIFGLTGYFEGWFSNDEASIPILAKMKVIIGNVRLELKEWKRNGWNPPKYIQ